MPLRDSINVAEGFLRLSADTPAAAFVASEAPVDPPPAPPASRDTGGASGGASSDPTADLTGTTAMTPVLAPPLVGSPPPLSSNVGGTEGMQACRLKPFEAEERQGRDRLVPCFPGMCSLRVA